MLNIFLPIRLKNHFIIKKNIIIIYITEYSFTANLVELSGKQRIILKSINHTFEESRNIYDVEYLYNLMLKLISSWPHDYAKVILPSNIIIFRSLISPFDDIEKTKMTAPFELEPFLPFSLSEATIDIIYQNKIKNNHSNKILTAVTKEDFINIYREACSKAHIILGSVSIDSIEIIQYVLYHSNIAENLFFVLYKNFNQLSCTLYTNNGLIGIKNIILEKNNSEYNADLINRTLSVLLQENKINTDKISLYTINISDEDEIIVAIKKTFLETNVFQINKEILTNTKAIIYKNSIQNSIEDNNAYIIFNNFYQENDYFNLAHKELNDERHRVLFKQIIICFIFTISLIAFFFLIYFVEYYRIQSNLIQTENLGIAYLKKEFNLPNKDTNNIDTAIKEAKKIITNLEKDLPIPVTHKKFLFINIFTKLTQTLSKNIIGLVFHEIKWKLKGPDNRHDSLYLIGEVKDFDSLHILEDSLKKSNLFVDVATQQDLQFNFHLLIMNEGES